MTKHKQHYSVLNAMDSIGKPVWIDQIVKRLRGRLSKQEICESIVFLNKSGLVHKTSAQRDNEYGNSVNQWRLSNG